MIIIVLALIPIAGYARHEWAKPWFLALKRKKGLQGVGESAREGVSFLRIAAAKDESVWTLLLGRLGEECYASETLNSIPFSVRF